MMKYIESIKEIMAAPFVALLLAMAISSGCSARNVYDGIRFHQEMDCSQLQGADRDECYRRSGMSYDEYQKQLKDRQKDQ